MHICKTSSKDSKVASHAQIYRSKEKEDGIVKYHCHLRRAHPRQCQDHRRSPSQ